MNLFDIPSSIQRSSNLIKVIFGGTILSMLALLFSILSYCESRRSTEIAERVQKDAAIIIWQASEKENPSRLELSQANGNASVQRVEVQLPEFIGRDPIDMDPGNMAIYPEWIELGMAKHYDACAKVGFAAVVMGGIPIILKTNYSVSDRPYESKALYALHFEGVVTESGLQHLKVKGISLQPVDWSKAGGDQFVRSWNFEHKC